MRALAQNRTPRTVATLANQRSVAANRSAISQTYLSRVRNTRFSQSVEYWPLNEAAGAVAFGNIYGRNGAVTGVTIGQPGVGDGGTAYLFDGVNDLVNLSTPSLTAAFNGVAGSWGGFIKASGSGIWTDGIRRELGDLGVNSGTNYAYIRRETSNNNLTFTYLAGSVTSSNTVTVPAAIRDSWFHVMLTWDKNAGASGEMKSYVNGVQIGVTRTGLGTWAGSLSSDLCTLGSFRVGTPVQFWSGSLAHWKLWNVALIAGEIAELALVLP